MQAPLHEMYSHDLEVFKPCMVECSMENFMHKDYRLIYLHLFTGCFLKICVQCENKSSGNSTISMPYIQQFGGDSEWVVLLISYIILTRTGR